MSNAHDMTGKTVLVTGANSGVGFVTATHLAQVGAEILMVCRDEGRGAAARAQIAAVATGPPPQLFLADLSSQDQIHEVARSIRGAHERIDVLINNAGTVHSKRELSVDGIEMTFATNHLGPFLLTHLLLDLVQASPAGRIATVATEVYAKRLDFANLQGERSYQFFKAYQASKLANILFAFELARRLDGTNVTSNACSPGPTKTGFGSGMTGTGKVFTSVMKRMPMFKSPEDGARTQIQVASDPALAGVTGRFFYKQRAIETKPVTLDLDVAAKLWRRSEELVGTAATVRAVPSEAGDRAAGR